jgi:RNA polymerase sigma factor (TIGR02999 family)
MHTDVTKLLAAASDGSRAAFDRLYAAVYAELRGMAASRMRRERRAVTLQPTMLVNEAWLRLAKAEAGSAFVNRAQFFFAASESMRRILVEYARRRRAQKRGGASEHVTLSGLEIAAADDTDVLEIDAALQKLAVEKPRLAQLVTLRYFAGLSIEDAAAAMEISPATAKRDWSFARAWLLAEIGRRGP